MSRWSSRRNSNALLARRAKTQPDDRALLVFPPGLEFLVAFIGCLIAGVIAVPMMLPRRKNARDSSAGIIANCEPVVALTSAAFASRKDPHERFAREQLEWLTVDLTPAAPRAAGLPEPDTHDIAFLQCAEVGCSPNFGYDLCVSRYRA
ncbi:MAG: hypothetical protein ABJA75_23005, partial [Bradyrhizobium sp.]